MADTFDSLLRTRLQQTGNNRDTWGQLLNTNTLNLLSKSIAGRVQVTVAGEDRTLTTNNGSEDEARYAILDLVGSPGAARNIIIPAVSKVYVVRNATGSTMTVKTVGGCVLQAKKNGNRITLTDEKGGVATVTIADVRQSNGVIHVIDSVLLPAS